MIENKDSIEEDFDPDTAPDLSRDGWPEKFANVAVRRGRPPVARPKISTTIRAITGCDRSLPCRREGLADTDRRGASRVDQERVRGVTKGRF